MGRPLLRHLPNRWRLTCWVLVAVLIVTGVTGAAAVRMVETKFTDGIDDDLRAQSRGIVTAAAVIGFDELAEIASEPGFYDNEHVILVLGPEGTEIAVPSGPSDAPDPLPDVEAISIDRLRGDAGRPFALRGVDGDTDYRAVAAQLDDGRVAVIAMPLTGLDDAITALIHILLVAALVATFLLAVTVAIVSGHVTRPLDAMIDTAEAIGAGDLQARVATDGVDDVARLAGALNAMLDRLERAFAAREASEDALRRFVADASHELRTPLAAVLGYAELYRSHMARTPEQVGHAMERIASEGERMRMIVEELLLLARLDENRPMERADVDLAAVTAMAVADARAIEPDRPLHLEVAPGPAVVAGDPLSLRQAVDNLLANTRAHTPAGTPVTVTVGRDADGVTVRVADDGPGLTAEDAARVFDRFFRAERSRARPGGSGLGLAIVAAIAEAHDGTVTVASAPGEGSTFTLTVPAAPAAAPGPALVPAPAAPAT